MVYLNYPVKFKISYPFLASMPDSELQNKINALILKQVNELFRNQVLIPEKIDVSDIDGNYTIHLNKSGLLSIMFNLYTYNEGANGLTKYTSTTIDLTTGEVYELPDLLDPKIYYETFLNELAKQYIAENNIQLKSEYEGITKDQQFYLTPDSLVLYYQNHTSSLYGLFKIEIPYNKITNILGSLSPIQRLL